MVTETSGKNPPIYHKKVHMRWYFGRFRKKERHFTFLIVDIYIRF